MRLKEAQNLAKLRASLLLKDFCAAVMAVLWRASLPRLWGLGQLALAAISCERLISALFLVAAAQHRCRTAPFAQGFTLLHLQESCMGRHHLMVAA